MKRTDRLLHLKRFHLEELKRRIATFVAMNADIERELTNLDHNIAREKHRARDNDMGRLALPSLLNSIKARREKLINTRNEIQRELLAAQLELSNAVDDLKGVEIASEELAKRLAEMQGLRRQTLSVNMPLTGSLLEPTLRSA
jgi:chromosome segregation ATPase